MIRPMDNTADLKFTIRDFAPADGPACERLYKEALISGRIADNDTGLDIDDIQHAYMQVEGNRFFVAVLPDGEIIGMIGVMHADGTGEIRRLRVAHGYRRRGVGSGLLERALEFCREKSFLKVALDTYIDREPAVKLFQKFHFTHGKTRTYGDKEMLDFYLDLYSSEDTGG